MDIFKDKRSYFHPTFSSYSKNFGFTLIVLLLLLAVIGIIISYQITTLQQKEQEQKVERTALQIQAILEAGLAYNEDNHHWPSKYPPEEHDFAPYLPFNRLSANPFGPGYFYSVVNNGFQVETAVPNDIVAKQIAALLPNGKVVKKPETNFFTVIATIGSSGKVDSKIFISSVRWSRLVDANFNGTSTPGEVEVAAASFQCPAGYDGKLLVFPYYYAIASRIYTAVTPTIKAIGMKSETLACHQSHQRSEMNITDCSYVVAFQGQLCNLSNKANWWQAGSVCESPSKVSLTGPTVINDSGQEMQVANSDGSITILEVGYCEKQ